MANFPTSLDDNNSLYLIVNQAQTYLDGHLDSTGGNNGQSNSIDVEDGSDFPATGGFFLIGSELIKYTTRATNKLTGITRGYSDTTAAVHRDGALIKSVVMADYHNALKDAIIAIETALGAALSNIPKRWRQATDPVLTETTKAGDIWIDTSSGDDVVKMRVGASTGTHWVVVGA